MFARLKVDVAGTSFYCLMQDTVDQPNNGRLVNRLLYLSEVI